MQIVSTLELILFLEFSHFVSPAFLIFVQLTMERTETETHQRLNNKIEQLETELASMKTRLDQEVAKRHALGRTMDVRKVFYCHF